MKRIPEFGIETATAGPGEITARVSFPGEIALNADHAVQVTSRVDGFVREVRKTFGDRVRSGETMAIIESRELAEGAAEYLECRERQALAQTVFDRERNLREKNISSEQEMLDAQIALAEAGIRFRAAKQKLHALGLNEREIESAVSRGAEDSARYSITAPLDGVVIDRRITTGEALNANAPVFLVADLGTVWVDFQVIPRDIAFLSEGQRVVVSAGRDAPEAAGEIIYVGKVLDMEKRTALVRAVLPNPDGSRRPGLFVTGTVEANPLSVPVRIPVESIQMLDNNPVVFIRSEDGFIPRPVATGRNDSRHTEIVSGLHPGEEYVRKGAFHLKAIIVTHSLGGHAGHGH